MKNRPFMNKIILLAAWLVTAQLHGQNLYFPPLTGNAWDTVEPESLGWCEEEIPGLLDYLQEKNSRAFIVLKDGKIAIEKYFGTFTRDSSWYWASAGKSLTAFLTGLALQDGKLSLDDPSSRYLGKGWTSCSETNENKISIRHQLTMTTGLDDRSQDPDCTDPGCLKCLADPGTRWAYHNAPYTLLDGVLEGATGQNLNLFVNTRLSRNTGINGLYLKLGYNNVFFSKPRSMARFGLLMLNRGNWDGNQILKNEAYYQQMITSSQDLNKSYGYLWWLNGKESFMVPGVQFVFKGAMVPNAPADMYSALGKNGQILNIVPSQRLIVVRMGDDPGTGAVPVTLVDTLWQRLNKVLCSTTSVQKEIKEHAPFHLSPNPAYDQIHLDLPEGRHTLEIRDLQGKLLLHSTGLSGRTSLNIGMLPAGTCLWTLKSEDGRMNSGKLVLIP